MGWLQLRKLWIHAQKKSKERFLFTPLKGVIDRDLAGASSKNSGWRKGVQLGRYETYV
jgi:hypothetical protein